MFKNKANLFPKALIYNHYGGSNIPKGKVKQILLLQ